MSKSKTAFLCSSCGEQTQKWAGQCPHCHEWNVLKETTVTRGGERYQPLNNTNSLIPIGEIEATEEARFSTHSSELDRVLGGGLVRGGVVLIGGDPGIGKSTLLLQAMSAMSEHHKAIYVSGEESSQQIGLRAQRLDLKSDKLLLLSEIQLNRILDTLTREKPDVAVIDSIQTVYSEDIQPAPGSVSQVRECAAQLTRFAKASGTTLLLVGHVTKEGAIAGPRVLEHIVDTVLYFEGDAHSSFRLVRSIKNRFGAANELGVFAMTDRGLRGVSNPSALFLSQHEKEVAGCCVMVTQEGSRPLLVELQALVDTSHSANSRRLTVGLEQNRLAMLLAVLHRHAGIAAFDQDVFVNAVGGVRINEPASDLPVILAIVSSLRGKVVGGKTVAFGEIGLSGEVRAVQRGQDRLKEALKLGFNRAIIPAANAPKTSPKGIELIKVEHISQAIDAVF
ncbi:MAG: DNA repair protein RadA [Burkholderiales bacterium]|jgi:DNA repair protein RadA/Sms|nr:DNA repair protein RadA [Pseudomonadota bacterium]MDA1012286.1 DNA repair protein RadA [Pseudomonadota bacterium]|tara:strand:+ start:8406 stop:9755 length:1350 start_codon:yes stop_codon:yes gene_type:complete